MNEQAKTRTQAEAQDFSLPARYADWPGFAYMIDGYAVAKDMGLGDLKTWAHEPLFDFDRTGRWSVESVLELRLLLFFKSRQIRFVSMPEHEVFRVVHSLLKEIAARTGKPYGDSAAEEHFRTEEERWNTLSGREKLAEMGISIKDPEEDI